MRTVSKILGLPVISYETGERLSSIDGITYSDTTNKVVALLVSGGLFSEPQAIPFQDLQSIGEDAVVVSSAESITAIRDHPEVQAAVAANLTVMGKQVMTEDGRDLGKVVDLMIEEESGNITKYLVSGGLFANLYQGRPAIPAPKVLKVGEDVVFVPNETVQLLEEQKGGLRGAVESAGEKVQEAGEQVRSKGKEWKNAPETHEAMTKAKQSAEDFWTDVKDTAGNLKDQASQLWEERRIKAALGKPVNRVILDRQDNSILNIGDLITHQAIERAREAGMLDILLSSVYEREPRLSEDRMRSRAKAKA